MKDFTKKLRSTSGFTLVELIVVLVILAVLAAILVPTLTGYITQAQNQKDYDTAAELKQAAQAAVIKQHQQNSKWSYENLNPLASSDTGLKIDGKTEKEYVCDTAGVDSSTINWFYFNIDTSGAVTSTIQTGGIDNPNGRGKPNPNQYPTSACINGKVYYMQTNGSWAAAKMNANGTFDTEAITIHNVSNGSNRQSSTNWKQKRK